MTLKKFALTHYCYHLCLCMLFILSSTISSAVADKPRETFIQYAMAWLTP